MQPNPRPSLFAASLLLLFACGDDSLPRAGEGPGLVPSGVDVPRPTLASLLGAGAAVDLGDSANAEQPSQVAFRLSGDLAADEPECVLPISAGHLTLWLQEDGTLELDRLTLLFDDINLDPQPLLPDGLVLTDIEVSLSSAALDEVAWHDNGTRLSTGGQLNLLLDWAWHPVDAPDDLHPLTSQAIEALALDFTVSFDAELGLAAELSAERAGQVWTLSNVMDDGELVTMHDPVLALRSTP